MHPRYPAPNAQWLFSDQSRNRYFHEVTVAYAIQLVHSPMPPPEGMDRRRALLVLKRSKAPTVEAWKAQEETHGHEIVGWLAAFLAGLNPQVHRYIHYGLTSSDLTEYALHSAIWSHQGTINQRTSTLAKILRQLAQAHEDTLRAGRTHGQLAEVTSLGHQFRVFGDSLGRILTNQPENPPLPIKSPGPTGYGANLGLPQSLGVGAQRINSTQILPRDFLHAWACHYLQLVTVCDQLATFVRLGCRSEIAEFIERGASDRVGSSAMAGKRNPIDSEKVCGLARVARGYFNAIIEVSNLWEDRDLTNSSTERVAVPGLAATLEHMIDTITAVIDFLEIDVDQVYVNSRDERCYTNQAQARVQTEFGVGPLEAQQILKEHS